MFGIDISKHQKGINLENIDFDFAIIKATEGTTYIDPCFEDFAKTIQSMNKLLGVYHYARPDNHPSSDEMRQEADHFINTITKLGLIGKAILILDWEQNPTNRVDLMDVWVDTVNVNTGIKPFVYASNSLIKQYPLSFYKHPLWNAKWPSIEKMYHPASIDWILKNIPDSAMIWQYSSSGVVKGWNGRVDLDYTSLTRMQWCEYAGDVYKVEEYISDDMRWAIDNGLFTGYPDGTYKPYEALTRQAAASLFKRFHNMINN